MSEDWAAVAAAIKRRVNELGWRQRELAQRSHVSQATVREIQHHTVERRRSARTLEALSVALGWHPQHLAAVLHHRRPPKLDDHGRDIDPVLSRLDAIHVRLGEIEGRLDKMNADLHTVIGHVPDGC